MSNNTLRLLNNNPAQEQENLTALLEDWHTQHEPLLHILLDAYCVLDLKGNVVKCNVAFETLLEQSERRILKNPHFNFFLKSETTPESWEKVFSFGQNWFRDDEVAAEIKIKNQTEPKIKKLIVAAIPIFSSGPQRIGTLVTLRNVTDESNVQNERIESINRSNTDGLTQLCNKVFTTEWLKRQLELARRTQSPLSIMMGDVDHFKKVNDTYGHQAGDHVLQTVARLLQESIRKGDVAGRFGGEEFILIMPHTNQAGALTVAERFRKLIEGVRIEFEGKIIPLTISLGTSTFLAPAEKETPLAEDTDKNLISQCDLALYEAKHSGRNRTRQFENFPKEKVTDPKKS
jgi:diguanylate cyclase (GGDEF)-like protein